TLEEIIKALKELLEFGFGDLVVYVKDHKIPRIKYTESREPEEKDGANS
ncbi:unnamed protein product, partial [marine sediment metagenome]